MARKRFWTIIDMIMDGFAFLAGILLLLVTFFVSYSVVIRYIHLKPPIWILQYTEYALLWITFLGAAWLLRKGGHIRIDTVITRLGPKTQSIIEVIIAVLGFVVCIIIVWFGTEKTLEFYQRGILDVKAVIVPLYPLFLIIPLGGLLLLLQFGRNIYNRMKDLKQE
jgi:TRAP-type C4-dicarboxylate transport system permease small subunit